MAHGYRVTTLHGDLKALADYFASLPAGSWGVGTKQGRALSVVSVGGHLAMRAHVQADVKEEPLLAADKCYLKMVHSYSWVPVSPRYGCM